MAETLDWVIVLIAGSSLIFASIALIQIKMTTKSVNSFLERANKFLNRMPKDISKVINPEFVADTITQVLTKDIKNPDGSPVSMPQFINGYIVTYGPGLKEEFKKELPNIMTHLLNPQQPPPPGPGGPQNPGQALVAQRGGAWGSGGLTAATKVAKAAKKVPLMGKIGEAVETARDLVALKGTLVELKDELFPAKGDNGSDQHESSSDQGQLAWGPPY